MSVWRPHVDEGEGAAGGESAEGVLSQVVFVWGRDSRGVAEVDLGC
jgi:hypothetical protein